MAAKKKAKKKATAKKATAKKATKKKVAKKATAKKATKKKVAKKATAKKATKKKVAKKATAKKATAKAAPKKVEKRVIGPAKTNFDKVSKTRTKGQILGAISESTGLTKVEVRNVFETLADLVGHDLGKGPGTFTMPGLLKMIVRRKPATKARKGINPFTGEETTFKAKPAKNIVRARPLKNLKEMVL